MVTPPVKSVTLRTMRLDVDSTPCTMVAAKAAPGKVGRLTRPEVWEPPGALEAARTGRLGTVRAQGR